MNCGHLLGDDAVDQLLPLEERHALELAGHNDGLKLGAAAVRRVLQAQVPAKAVNAELRARPVSFENCVYDLEVDGEVLREETRVHVVVEGLRPWRLLPAGPAPVRITPVGGTERALFVEALVSELEGAGIPFVLDPDR